jgi:hypothetical protein
MDVIASLKDEQRAGCEAVVKILNDSPIGDRQHRGCILADGPGSGKTITALISALTYLSQYSHHGSILVVCLKGLIDDGWLNEANVMLKGSVSVHAIHSFGEWNLKVGTLKSIETSARKILILSKETTLAILSNQPEELRSPFISFVIFDEAHLW